MNLKLNVVRFENEDVIATSCDCVQFTASTASINGNHNHIEIKANGLAVDDTIEERTVRKHSNENDLNYAIAAGFDGFYLTGEKTASLANKINNSYYTYDSVAKEWKATECPEHKNN